MLYLYMNQTLVSIFETQGSKFLNFYQKYLRIESLDNEYISNCSFHKVTFTTCSFEECEFVDSNFTNTWKEIVSYKKRRLRWHVC